MMEIGPGMISRSHNVSHFFLMNVNRLLVAAEHMPPLKKFTVLLQHGVIVAGLLVKERVSLGVVFNDFGTGGSGPGTPHSKPLEGVVSLPVTGSAHFLAHIPFGKQRRVAVGGKGQEEQPVDEKENTLTIDRPGKGERVACHHFLILTHFKTPASSGDPRHGREERHVSI